MPLLWTKSRPAIAVTSTNFTSGRAWASTLGGATGAFSLGIEAGAAFGPQPDWPKAARAAKAKARAAWVGGLGVLVAVINRPPERRRGRARAPAPRGGGGGGSRST